ncbi:hypothetical protein [Pontibacter sp. HSC-36F09]|nr:hypothetical protein [Pontibacter sp. HSC-36F09]
MKQQILRYENPEPAALPVFADNADLIPAVGRAKEITQKIVLSA